MSGCLYEKPLFRLAGDRGLLVEFGDAIDPAINDKVRALALAMELEKPLGVRELIATYRSLIIIYDPVLTDINRLKRSVSKLERNLPLESVPPPEVVHIPVCYGGDFGPDIEFVAKVNHLTVPDVIDLHTEPLYKIYMLGFTPGFPFLGGLVEKLHTPRLSTPRVSVPAGSVGIANTQTGIYPIASPGGWQLIGRTPLKLLALEREKPILLKAGDLLKFDSILPEEFYTIAGREGD